MSIYEYRDNIFLKSHSTPCSEKDWSTRVCYKENADKYNAAGSLLQYEVIISHESGTIVAMTTCHQTHDVYNSESSTIYRILEHLIGYVICCSIVNVHVTYDVGLFVPIYLKKNASHQINGPDFVIPNFSLWVKQLKLNSKVLLP